MSNGMRMIMARESEFPDRLSAQLTGIALDSNAREYADAFLTARFEAMARATFRARTAREVIIGSGFHAATYAATRVLAGFDAPIILESADRVGGTFAYGRPVFYLNSRNRRGDPGLSGDGMANLNYLPGAPLQASNISTGEYQTNADMALIVRLALAQSGASINIRTKVTDVTKSSDGFTIDTETDSGNRIFTATRIIDARGVGEAKYADMANGTTVLTFAQFMERMCGIWPLRNVRRAAVIGAGDSARCAVESLLGLAPQPSMAAAELDTVGRIDWYGAVPDTFESFCREERGRYKPIGRFLRADTFGQKRLNVFRNRAFPTALPNGKALINGRAYDVVILAAGSDEKLISGMGSAINGDYENFTLPRVVREFRDNNTEPIATRYYNDSARSDVCRFRVGPHARLDFTRTEVDSGVSRIPNNRVAMFRLATKTATLAAGLPNVVLP